MKSATSKSRIARRRSMDEQQPQYFTPNEAPATVPPFWRTPKGALVIGVAALSVVLITVFLVNLFGSRTLTKDMSALDKAIENCATAENPEACKADARTDAARNGEGSRACAGLERDALRNCVALAAYASLDEDECAALSGDEKQSCVDQVRLRRALANDDYAACAAISDDDVRTACEQKLLFLVVADGACAQYGVDVTVCDAETRQRAIIDAGDYDACATLSSAAADECREIFASTDRDADGLNRREESMLGTSDDHADTDGDGYTDKQEVESGHDPLQ